MSNSSLNREIVFLDSTRNGLILFVASIAILDLDEKMIGIFALLLTIFFLIVTLHDYFSHTYRTPLLNLLSLANVGMIFLSIWIINEHRKYGRRRILL